MAVIVALGAAVAPAAPSVGPKIHLRAQTIDPASAPNDLFAARASFENNRYYILQLDGPMTPTRRAALTEAGVALGGYYPRDAYLADISLTSPKALEELGFVRWAGVYRDAWKLDPSIGHRLTPFQSKERQALASLGMLRLTVVLMPGGELGRAIRALRLIGANILARNTIGAEDVVTLEVDANQLPAIAAIAEVRYVEESAEITFRNSTTRWIVQSNQVDVTPLYDNGLTGLGQIVGIMDGQIDIDHCSFFDDAPIGPDHRKVEAYNTTLGGDFHGTHVAGIVVGDGGAFDNTRGVAYEGRLVFNAVPTFAEAAMYGDLLTHQNQGARIHTNSWGNDATTGYDGLARGIDLFSWDFEDSLVLFAVTNLGALKNPENAKNLVAVGASQDTPDQDSHCSGGVGPTSDGRRKPEVYAPGCSSTSSKAGTSCGIFSDTGTSMACPAVAGVAMLIRQYFVNGYYLSGTANPAGGFVPTGALIKATLLNSATDMTGVPGYPSDLEGWGRVLADDALYFRGDVRSLIVLDDLWNASGLSTGEERLYDVRVVDSAETLRVTLVWTDAPASVGAGLAAVNDLDIEVTSPGGTMYLGNVFSGGVSVSGGLPDDRNNVEQVHVNLPETGAWSIRVRGTAVNDGTQGFALIVTGGIARSCTLATDCDDLYPCTLDDCDGTGACVHSPDPGLTCDDGSLCTSGDTCTVDGNCVGVPLDAAVDCDDGIACTLDTCSPLDGCINRSVPGMACNDNDACTIGDTCQPGAECIGTPVDPSAFCDDGTICTVDTCAWDVGCVHTPTPGLGCEDNDACTVNDQCDEQGSCAGTPIAVLFGDIQLPPGTVDIDDLLYLLSAFAATDQCVEFPDANIFPCNAPCSASPIDVDDVLSILSAFASDPPCPDECPLR